MDTAATTSRFGTAMSTSTSPSWRASRAAGVSAAGARTLPAPGADAAPPDETVWSGPALAFLLSLVVAIPIIFAVLMLTSFSVLQDSGDAVSEAAPVAADATETPAAGEAAPAARTVAVEPAAAEEAAAAVAAALEEPEVPAQPLDRIYVVVAGDVLSRIAQRFAVTVEAIAAYNELSNPNALRIGQELRIPPPGYQPPDPEAEESTDFATGPLSPG
ncbi:MAG: LysM peptidoglycan-binding domain-containing protein [Chloroflexi bacterium]|nr:LysM peptidoglycan-binding domain-containing protein [Chloroflexota bacterium]